MRRVTVMVLLMCGAVVGVASREAAAADFYTNRNLQPGADAGTTAPLLLSDAGIQTGAQFMINCETNEVTYRLCQTGAATCLANANDKKIGANRDYDICGVSGYGQLSVFRVYDGGIPSCRVYIVNPQSKDCAP